MKLIVLVTGTENCKAALSSSARVGNPNILIDFQLILTKASAQMSDL